MTQRHTKLRGWMRLWRELKMRFRLEGKLSLCDAGNAALHEVRVRDRMAKVIGRMPARNMALQACAPADITDGWRFVITEPIDWATWKRFDHIPELLLPILRDEPAS